MYTKDVDGDGEACMRENTSEFTVALNDRSKSQDHREKEAENEPSSFVTQIHITDTWSRIPSGCPATYFFLLFWISPTFSIKFLLLWPLLPLDTLYHKLSFLGHTAQSRSDFLSLLCRRGQPNPTQAYCQIGAVWEFQTEEEKSSSRIYITEAWSGALKPLIFFRSGW